MATQEEARVALREGRIYAEALTRYRVLRYGAILVHTDAAWHKARRRMDGLQRHMDGPGAEIDALGEAVCEEVVAAFRDDPAQRFAASGICGRWGYLYRKRAFTGEGRPDDEAGQAVYDRWRWWRETEEAILRADGRGTGGERDGDYERAAEELAHQAHGHELHSAPCSRKATQARRKRNRANRRRARRG